MSTANDRAVLNMILNPLLPNEPFDPNGNPNPVDPFESLPKFAECRELEKSGIKLAEDEKFDEAIKKFNEAIDICPQNPHPYNNRAQAYRLQNMNSLGFSAINQSMIRNQNVDFMRQQQSSNSNQQSQNQSQKQSSQNQQQQQQHVQTYPYYSTPQST